ncbi:MAG: hypothetical protein LAT64_04195 [Phycisphaerales bacterium]|nr:hypothetical protein [Planctomycetota bacterium]MCH8507953.1 hypothetical protein [Phycisphaerales bacterium]
MLRTLKTGLAKRVIARWRELSAPVLEKITDPNGQARFWQRGGGYDRNIFTMDEFHEKLVYIQANPVRSGLVDHETGWKWSSTRWWAGDRADAVPCDNLVSV